MKKKSLTLLALVGLLLTGCQETKNSTTPSTPSDKVSEIKPVKSSETTGKPSSTANKNTGTDKTSQGKGDSASLSVDLTAGWSTKVQNFRKENLGGQLIPYINLGSPISYDVYEESKSEAYHLEIQGSASFSAVLVNTFETNYRAANYSVNGTTRVVTASSAESHITVTLRASDDNNPVLHINYDEPYEPSKRIAYSNDIKEEFKAIFDSTSFTHSNDVPLLYLGTTTPTWKERDSGAGVVINGRKWTDSILTDTKAVLDNAKYDTSKSTEEKVVGIKTFDDGYGFSIVIKKASSVNGFGYYPERSITLLQPFTPSSFTKWPDSVLYSQGVSLEEKYFDGHKFPVVYLGTDNPFISTHAYGYQSIELGVDGGLWDDRIRSNALTVLTADGYSENQALEKEKAPYRSNILIREKTETDGCNLRIFLYEDESGNATIEFYLDPAFGKTDEATAWDNDIQSAFKKNCSDLVPPFVYLGKKVFVEETSSANKISLVGRKWNDLARSNAKSVLSTWTENSEEESSSCYDDVLILDSPVDPENGVVWKRTRYKYSYNKIDRVKCIFTRKSVYNKNDPSTNYPNDVLEEISDRLNGETIPYVYLGTKSPEAEWDYSDGKLRITGESWDDEIITNAVKAFKDNGSWTEEGTATASEVCFTKKTEKGYYRAKVYQNYGTPEIDVFYLPWTSQTDYSDSVKAKIATLTDNVASIPYVFIGEDSDLKVSYSGSSLEITGSAKKNDILTMLFNETFKDSTDGWTVDESNNVATLTKDGYAISVTLDDDWGTAQLLIKVVPPYNSSDSATRSYSDADRQLISQNLGNNTIPMVYLGRKHPIVSKSGNNGIQISGALWKDSRLRDNRDILTKAGYTVSYITEGEYHHDGYSTGAAIQGYKSLGTSPKDGYIRFVLSRTTRDKTKSSSVVYFYYDCPQSIDDGSSTTEKWNENAANKKLRSDNLGGTILPYMDLVGNVTREKQSNSLVIKGSYSTSGSLQAKARAIKEALKAADPTLKTTYLDLCASSMGRTAEWMGTAKDGNVLTYSLTCSSSITLTVTYSKAFDKAPETDWNSDIKTARTEELGGHVIPYFSIGTKEITLDTGINTLTLNGSLFDYQAITQAKEALAKDTLSWTCVDNGSNFRLASAYAENGHLTIQISQDSKGNITCTRTFVPKAA